MSARPRAHTAPCYAPFSLTALALAVLAMGLVVLASNILVMYPINDWLTWGAFSYPLIFLVSNLINRRFGPQAARRLAWAGFAVAVVLSVWLATPRIALASSTAFICAQLLDIRVFDRLRLGHWWRAPSIATTCSATLDTALFWSIAFAGAPLPWVSWMVGDWAIKLAIGLCLLVPFRALLWKMAPPGLLPSDTTAPSPATQ